jgi:glutamate--cysteine ligase
LGSALTHPTITTDYSEALLELITAPHRSIKNVLKQLDDLHRWVYAHLDDEFLWATSMPCIINGEDSIRIADYGSSNIGTMKTVYRRGLGHRYGKMMQVISGVHFNYSVPLSFWAALQNHTSDSTDPVVFRSENYMEMLRNLQRFGWLIPYLFGASPAVCESFLNNQPTRLNYLAKNTYYEPYATSLRLGDIGYQNKKEGQTGVKINYNGLKPYAGSLENATETPCPEYRPIGVNTDDGYRQLNDHQLQIENEYYSSARPKTILRDMEKPVRALEDRGIEYVELRSIDVNAFDPLGVSETQLYFLEVFMIYSLLKPSAPISDTESQMINTNMNRAAHSGRDPDCALDKPEGQQLLCDWAAEIMDELKPICAWLDQDIPSSPYLKSVENQMLKINQPDTIPSTQIIQQLTDQEISYFQFAKQQSLQTAEYFRQRPLETAQQNKFKTQSIVSQENQTKIEAADSESFSEFLEHYFAQ